MLKYLIIPILLASCSVSKNLNKSKETNDTKIESQTIATNTAVTTSTVTESVHTLVAIPGNTISGEVDLNTLLGGDSLHEDNPTMKITAKVIKGRLKVSSVSKPKLVPIKFNRVTVTAKNETTAIKQDLTKSVKTSSVTSSKDVERGWSMWNWLWLLLVIPAWFVWKRYR